MRSIWNGAISFGLVSIPIKLVNATENRSISFRQIHAEDGGRIRYRKVCELDGEEVGSEEIGKAYEETDGTMIPITDEDLAALPLPTAKTIEIVSFVPASEIDPLQMGTAYYLSANGVPAAKPYTLLREALKRSDRVAIAKFALRGRERLGMLRVVDEVIAMHGLLWPDEIRRPEGVAPDTSVSVRDAELDLADALMDTLGQVDIDELHDDYRAAVEEMIAAKAEGALEAAPEPKRERGGQVIDLMAALEGSVRAARESRGEERAAEEREGVGEEPGGEPAEASVTELPARGRGKSAATAGKAGAKSAGAGSGAKKTAAAKKTAKSARTDKSAAPAAKSASTSGKSSAAKSSAGKSAEAGQAAAKSSAGRSSTAKPAAGKSAAGKSPAKKTVAPKRSA
ncbi:Ku protein [Streptomyces sp. LP05-1]|uniref:Non-homologous end joining protein Ku n=1 Tax=Streptomyces pyxinae TaxID=2970734 RepID=A0ABT2CA54_9ACTN|nr:Ku protein [Streptomyces sp. LP05-1]MCS0634272.1 Ku protein [Streptomyces sp. LP05-1]